MSLGKAQGDFQLSYDTLSLTWSGLDCQHQTRSNVLLATDSSKEIEAAEKLIIVKNTQKSTVWALMCSHHGQRCKMSVETGNAPSKCFSLEIQLNYVMWLACSLRRPGVMMASRIHHVVSLNSFWHIGLHQFKNNYCSWVSIYTNWGNICWLRSDIHHI